MCIRGKLISTYCYEISEYFSIIFLKETNLFENCIYMQILPWLCLYWRKLQWSVQLYLIQCQNLLKHFRLSGMQVKHKRFVEGLLQWVGFNSWRWLNLWTRWICGYYSPLSVPQEKGNPPPPRLPKCCPLKESVNTIEAKFPVILALIYPSEITARDKGNDSIFSGF